jgi:hypothetical protein
MIDHSLQALLDDRDVEVDEQADGLTGQLEIGQQLRGMNRKQFRYLFQLDYHGTFHDQIDSKSTIKVNAFIADGQLHLSLKTDDLVSQLVVGSLKLSRLDFFGNLKFYSHLSPLLRASALKN